MIQLKNNKRFAILKKIRLAEEEAIENDAGDKKDVLSPQEKIAKAAILAACDKLVKAGVTFVAVHFDGIGGRWRHRGVEVFRQRILRIRRARSRGNVAAK